MVEAEYTVFTMGHLAKRAGNNSSRSSNWKSQPARVQLLSLYAEVDALLAPYACDASTECCRFGITGREPYPTAVERAEIDHAVAAIGGERALARRLPVFPAAERACPFLSEAGRCRIYASRPFGCRTFFCDRVTGPGKLPRQEIQRISRDIAALSASTFPADPHPRPLTHTLRKI